MIKNIFSTEQLQQRTTKNDWDINASNELKQFLYIHTNVIT